MRTTGSDEPGAGSPVWTLRVSLVGLPKSPAPHDLALNWSSGLARGRGGFQLRPGERGGGAGVLGGGTD